MRLIMRVVSNGMSIGVSVVVVVRFLLEPQARVLAGED
jgi:hypothetical protein